MSLQLLQSEAFLHDLEDQFRWYVHESKLDLSDAVELAQKFKIADFLVKNPAAGRRRFPQFTDVHKTLARGV